MKNGSILKFETILEISKKLLERHPEVKQIIITCGDCGKNCPIIDIATDGVYVKTNDNAEYLCKSCGNNHTTLMNIESDDDIPNRYLC